MNPALHEFIRVDLSAMLAGLFAAVACGVLGNFLVLRRLSLMGDAISHAVLPGIMVAFIVARSRDPLMMLAGAAGAGIITVGLVEIIKRFGRVESGAAMGVTFSIMFALGVVMLEQVTRHVHLDADCVLYGNLEYVTWWAAPAEPAAYLRWETYRGVFDAELGRHVNGMPPQTPILAGAALLAFAFVIALFKELRIASFDAGLASALGFRAGVLHLLLMVVVAMATVAAFEAVGSILVIAMLICPAATARLLTDRLSRQVWLSVAIAGVSSVGGYVLGAFGPGWLGAKDAVNAAGMMCVMAGAMLLLAMFLSPAHGIVARWLRRMSLGVLVLREDLLALLYRAEEVAGTSHVVDIAAARRSLGAGWHGRLAVRQSLRRGDVRLERHGLALTDQGRRRARSIIRSHRLWESYLVREVGLRPDHVHDTAMVLEHLRERGKRLEPQDATVTLDPHDRGIPSRE